MENPHAERQAVLLERILKNTVSSSTLLFALALNVILQQSKCTEMILELNHCVEVGQTHFDSPLFELLISVYSFRKSREPILRLRSQRI